MRVCLVRGGWVSWKGSVNNEPVPPIGLAYLAGSLKAAGFEVRGVDAVGQALDRVERIPGTPLRANGLGIDDILSQIDPRTHVIGVSAMFTHEWPYYRGLITSLKRRCPGALIIAGGEHSTGLPEYSLRDCPSLDYIGLGEGEETMSEFCRAVERSEDPAGVKGLAFLRDGRFVVTTPRPRLRDIDAIPWPDWDAFEIEPYLSSNISYGASFGRNMPIAASRGCPYQCTFCSSPGMWTTRYAIRSPDKLLDEIEHYRRRFEITGVQFYDLTMIIRRDWILDYCRKAAARGLELGWSLPSGTRSEALDGEVLDAMAAAGCRYLTYAPESGSAETLKRIKKKVNLDRMERSIRGAVERGIAVRTNLIIGFPHESRGRLFETLRQMVKFAWMGVEEAPLFPFQPYPGTELFRGLVERGEVKLDDEYFQTLASLSTGTLSPPRRSFCEHVGRLELYFYRLLGLILFTGLSYLLRPKRIWRTFHNLAFTDRTATVAEQRVRDRLRRLRARFTAAPGERVLSGDLAPR